MFGEGYFSVSFEAILGFAVTVVSVWLVIKQLNETKLATQMDALLGLMESWNSSVERRKPIQDLINSSVWDTLSPEEAHERVNEKAEILFGYQFMLNWYELIGVLVRRKAIDGDIVYEYMGEYISARWKKLQKVTKVDFSLEGWRPNNWEWLAKEFENYAG